MMELITPAVGTCVLFAVGWMGVWVARELHIPAAAILGSLVSVGVLSLCDIRPEFFEVQVSFAAKIFCGILIGQKISREALGAVKKMFVPVFSVALWMLATSIALGFLLHKISGNGLSVITSLAASSTGGIGEMAVFAMSSGGDVGVVTFFQSMRLLMLYLSLPVTTSLLKKYSRSPRLCAPVIERSGKEDFSVPEIILFLAVTCIGGVLMKQLRIPAAVMLGAMITSGIMNVKSGKTFILSGGVKDITQIALGISIGVSLSPHTLVMMRSLFGPMIVTVGLIQCSSLLLAYVLSRFTTFDLMTLVLASCPGGISQIIFFAEDLHADPFTVSVFHAVRLTTIVTVVPLVALMAV